MNSKVAKVAVTGGIALATMGVGAGVASAQPGPSQPNNWGQNSFQQQQQWNQPGRNNQPPPPRVQPQQNNGFWFFGQWIQLPF